MRNILRISARFFYRFFSVFFKVKRNQILFISYRGKSYSCNLKAIFNNLSNVDQSFKFIWVTTDIFDMSTFLTETIFCKWRMLRYYYYLSTSKIILSNASIGSEFFRKKSQRYINTWHGGGAYKRVGKMYKNTSKFFTTSSEYTQASYILSSSEMFTKTTIRNSFDYNGDILEIGMPRNDILIKQSLRQDQIKAIRDNLNLTYGCKIILYAPTWRDNRETLKSNLNAAKLMSVLSQRFGGEWVLLLRYHHEVNLECAGILDGIDVTSYPDMQELLYISDILITDYSSSIWDFSLTYKPCFLYCTDLEEYKQERDFYVPIEEWGFPVCQNNEELCDAILNFDEEKHKAAMIKHHKDLGSFETGEATKKVCDLIHEICFGHKPDVENGDTP